MGVPALGSSLEQNMGSYEGLLLTEKQSILSVEIFFFLMNQEILVFGFLASATALFTQRWDGTLNILFGGIEQFFIQ